MTCTFGGVTRMPGGVLDGAGGPGTGDADILVRRHSRRLDPSDAAETDLYSFDSSPLIYISINAIQELNREIEELKDKLKQFESRLNR